MGRGSTSSTLNASGSVKLLNREAWLERRERVKHQGGSPLPGSER